MSEPMTRRGAVTLVLATVAGGVALLALWLTVVLPRLAASLALASDPLDASAQLWPQIIQLGIVGLIGLWVVKTVHKMEIDQAAIRVTDAVRAESVQSLAGSFSTVLARLDAQDDVLSEFRRYLTGDRFTVGVVDALQADTDRRHELMGNFALLDAKIRILCGILVEIAEASHIKLDPLDHDALKQSIEFEKYPGGVDRRRRPRGA